MMEIGNSNMFSTNVIREHSQSKVFSCRISQLQKIRSNYMYPISKAQLRDKPYIIYEENKCYQTLANLINNKIELLPTQIKSIIWQVTRFMIECQEYKINHLRLHPKSIVLKPNFKEGKPIFIQIKDFCLGKEFKEVSEGKLLDFFEFMHPALSIENNMINFEVYEPRYDIWSFGVILYYLIYNVSPFCKDKKDKYSKTILRQYMANLYQIPLYNNKYNSINMLIAKCLSLHKDQDSLNCWKDVKKWILSNQQIYNNVDFEYRQFEDMVERHVQLMALFSSIYCMIIDQCNNSPHLFWRKPVSETLKVPFQIKVGQFTLKLMRTIHERFEKIYGGHFRLLTEAMQEVLGLIKKKIMIEQQHKAKFWLQPNFKEGNLNLQTIRTIQQVCAKVKIELSDLHPQLINSSRKIDQHRKANSFTDRRIWKSMQTLYDYCNQIILIFNESKSRMKLVYQHFYSSRTLASICVQDFKYKSVLES